MIAALQADGSLRQNQAAHLEQALRSSRVIGAAMGIVMAKLDVSDVEAFQALSRASQDTNRRLRVIAEEVVLARDLTALTMATSPSVDGV
jgi:AmiR/NasT family two-component response regulator